MYMDATDNLGIDPAFVLITGKERSSHENRLLISFHVLLPFSFHVMCDVITVTDEDDAKDVSIVNTIR